jgi:hypothetical protein
MKLLILGLIFSTNLLIAQTELNSSIFEYGIAINRAELYAIEHKYKEAIQIYDSLKKSNSILFTKDYFNASLCHALQKNDTSCLYYLEHLTQIGLTTRWLKENEVLQKCLSKKSWEVLISKEKIFSSKKNTLTDSLNSIFNADQLVRRDFDYWNKNRKNVLAADSINLKIFNKIIRDYSGLPTQNLTGVTDNNLFDTKYLIVMWHQTTETKQYDYGPLLLAEIKKGTIEPHVGAIFYRNCSGDGIKFGNIELVKGIYQTSIPDSVLMNNGRIKDSIETKYAWRIPLINPSLLDSLNKERISYGLESINDYLKKQLYMHNNPKTGFLFSPPKGNTFYFANEESYKMFINSSRSL